jgi:hypothetical protein
VKTIETMNTKQRTSIGTHLNLAKIDCNKKAVRLAGRLLSESWD